MDKDLKIKQLKKQVHELEVAIAGKEAVIKALSEDVTRLKDALAILISDRGMI